MIGRGEIELVFILAKLWLIGFLFAFGLVMLIWSLVIVSLWMAVVGIIMMWIMAELSHRVLAGGKE